MRGQPAELSAKWVSSMHMLDACLTKLLTWLLNTASQTRPQGGDNLFQAAAAQSVTSIRNSVDTTPPDAQVSVCM